MAERPDVIALAGEFASAPAGSLRAVRDVLACLDAPLGGYPVLGNHAYNVAIDEGHWRIAAHSGISDVTNRTIMREVHGVQPCITGAADCSKGAPCLDALPPLT